MQETARITSIRWDRKKSKFVARLRVYDTETGIPKGMLEVESPSLSRIVEMLAPANPTNA